MAEHQSDCRRRNPKSGLAVHTMEEGHVFNFAKTKILERIQDRETRSIAEVFQIKKRGEERTVNLQRECGNFNSVYNGLLAQLRRQPEREHERPQATNERSDVDGLGD